MKKREYAANKRSQITIYFALKIDIHFIRP